LLCAKIADAVVEGRRELEARQKDSEPQEIESESSETLAPEVSEAELSEAPPALPIEAAKAETPPPAETELVAEEAF
jgi:small subunit ribosomal protein S2